MAYKIQFSIEAKEHFIQFSARDRKVILSEIEKQLTNDLMTATRNKKPLRLNEWFPYELRVGKFRAFYGVDALEKRVLIIAIGYKEHNRLVVGNKVIPL